MAHHPSRSKALKFFLSSIQDPHSPRHCGICLNGAFTEYTGVPEMDASSWEPKFKYPIQNSPDLWNAIMKFLFIPRSKNQLDDLFRRLSTCKCSLGSGDAGEIKHYHDISNHVIKMLLDRNYNLLWVEDRPDDTKLFAVLWDSFLANLFVALTVTICHSSSRSSAKGVATFWPNRVADLIPFGADELVKSMKMWHFATLDPIIFRTMGAVLQVSQELVIPSLLAFGFTALVVQMAEITVQRLLSEHFMASSNASPSHLAAYTLWLFPWQTNDTIYYLDAMLGEPIEEELVYKMPLLHGCETKAVQLCSLLLYLSEALGLSTSTNHLKLSTIGQKIFRFFSLHMPSRPPFPVHPLIQKVDDARFPPEDRTHLSAFQILCILRKFRLARKCSAHGCSNSFNSAGKEFRRCGNCALVPYCGRECQKTDWRDPIYPHKFICPIIHELVDAVGGHEVLFSSTSVAIEDPSIVIEKMLYTWRSSKLRIPSDHLKLLFDWETSLKNSRGQNWPLEEKDLSPGLPDYMDYIVFLSKRTAKEPLYLEPLARWPEEVDKQLELLINQPFWNEEIDVGV